MSLFFLSTILLALAILGTIAVTLVWTSRGNRYYLTLREQGKMSNCQATRRVQS